MSTIKHGNNTSSSVSSDTSSFFESNTNLQKGFGLLDKLVEYGVKYDKSKGSLDMSNNVVMSRVKSGGVHSVESNGVVTVRGEYDRPLTEIAAEADANNFDMFISIHSNATTGDHNVPTHLNHLLYLYRGYDGTTYSSSQSASIEMAEKSWPHATSNKHMNFNWLSNPNQPRNNESYSNGSKSYYPSGTDAYGNPYWIKGDLTFMYGYKSGGSYIGYYGVLKHNVPGFLVEGYDHTYQPGLHRAMNHDVTRHEGEMYARGINDYFGWGKKDSYGKIYGIVRDHSVVMTHDYYQVTASNTVDANQTINQIDNKKPLNFVIVQLYNSAGTLVDTYTTDDEWNGAYMFKKVAPGTYTIKHSLNGYNEVTQTVTVTANETNYLNIDMRAIPDGEAVQGHYAYGLSLAKTDDKTYTATFKSTGAMSNGKIILTNSSTGEKTEIETGAVSKGSNTVTIDASKIAIGDYSWSIALDNPASQGYKLLYSDASVAYNNGTYYARNGVAIDKDQKSANFGTIYTTTGYAQGIQRYNPDFTKNGSKLFAGLYQNSSYANRLRTNSGKVYLSVYYNTASNGVYVYDPNASTASLTKILSSSTHGVGFIGEGANRKMYISANGVVTSGSSSNTILRYDIGTSDSWSGSYSSAFTTSSSVLINGTGDVITTDNAIIASQTRYSPNNLSDVPSFIVVNQSGTTTYNSATLNTVATDGSSLEGCNGGGIAITEDKSIFAVAEGAASASGTDISVKIFDVRWNGATPTFIYKYTIPLSGTYEISQMDFDHADNLYIASRQKGLLVYAIKTPARQIVTNGAGVITGTDPGTASAVDPEAAPNPDAEPGETDEAEDAQTEGYFAYGLSLTKSGNEYTFSFKSTGARKNGRIVLTNTSTGATTEIKTPVVKGQNTVTVNAYDIVKGTYTWAVKITNNANSTVTQVASDNSIVYNNGSANARIGVAIDKDQTSANFGTIYTMTAMGQGLQKFNPDMSKNGSKILTGMFGQDTSGSSSNRYKRTNRLEVNGGKVYVANYANSTYKGIWVYDPSGSETATSVESTPLYERGIGFYGTGSSRKAFVTTDGTLRRYDIGTSSSWAQSGYAANYAGVMINGDGDVITTANGIIVSQHRFKGLNDASVPAFAVFDHNLNLITTSATINSSLNGSQCGGMALSPDNKTFAIVDAYTDGSPADINVQVYNLTWSGSTPTFTHQYSIPLSGTQQVDQMEFDHAGNLYIASQQKGLLKYAVKTSARSTITSSTATVTGLGNAVPANVVATRQCYGEGSNTTEGSVDAKVTWTGDAGQYKVYYQTMRRDAEGNRVYDNNGTWEEAGTATIASGSTSGSFTHQGLAHGGDYDRIYNYKVANYYATPDYVGTSKAISGKGRTVTSFVPRVPVNAVFSQPTVEVNGVNQYTLDLKLDLSLNSNVFSASLLDDNDALPKASRYVIVVDEATAAVLNNASNASEVGEFVEGPIILSTNNCNHYEANGWYMIVDFDDVTPSSDLSKATKSFTWEDVDLTMTYQPQVYTISTRAFNFTANSPESVAYNITLPAPQWSANSPVNGDNVAEVIPVTGNQISSLVGNEDYPMGTFRKVGDTQNATNPVAITTANVIGATGVIEPLPVIDEIMNDWDITYTFLLKDAQGNVISSSVQDSKNNTADANLYTNAKKVTVDVLGLKVGCDESTAPDGRPRYTYNAANNSSYKLVVQTTYSRTINGELVEISNESESDIVVSPSFPAPEIDPYKSPGYLFLNTETHWDENCDINSGYYKYYYDAAVNITWNDFDDNLTRLIGYYANPTIECAGHPDAGSSDWVPYLAASVMTDAMVERYNTGLDATLAPLKGIGFSGTEDWSALANEECHIPVKVHYVWAGNEKLPDESKDDASFAWELSANYPVIIYDTPLLKINTAPQDNGSYDITAPVTRSASGYDMQMITAVNTSYKTLTMDGVIEGTLTGVEDVAYSNGALRLFPNPVGSHVTLQAPIEIIDVKIFATDGQLVKEVDADDTQVKIDVSDLASGVYVVHAAGTSTIMIKK